MVDTKLQSLLLVCLCMCQVSVAFFPKVEYFCNEPLVFSSHPLDIYRTKWVNSFLLEVRSKCTSIKVSSPCRYSLARSRTNQVCLYVGTLENKSTGESEEKFSTNGITRFVLSTSVEPRQTPSTLATAAAAAARLMLGDLRLRLWDRPFNRSLFHSLRRKQIYYK